MCLILPHDIGERDNFTVHLLSKEYTCNLRVKARHPSPGGTPGKHLLVHVRFASQTPNLICDQILKFSVPSLWQDRKFDILFMTVAAGTVL